MGQDVRDTSFTYFTKDEALQFSFIQLPRMLMKDKRFKMLSSDAKLLYGMMLDRMMLSKKNQWIDKEGRVYIFYSIEEIMEDFNCGKNKAVKILQELDSERGIGLVEKKRRGQGKNSVLYVKNFFGKEETVETDETEETEYEENAEESVGKDVEEKKVAVCYGEDQKIQSGIKQEKETKSDHVYNQELRQLMADFPVSLLEQMEKKDVYDVKGQTRNVHMQDVERQDVRMQKGQRFEKETYMQKEGISEVCFLNTRSLPEKASRIPKSKLLEVRKSGGIYTKENNNKYIYNQSDLILSTEEPRDKAMRCDEIRYDEMSAYTEIIKENLEFDALLQRYPYDRELLCGILDLILETVLIKSETVLISRNEYPAQLVKSKFLKLKYSHIEYVMECMKKNTSKINNIKKYLLAALFNAPSTMDGYYKAEVQYDMQEFG